MSLKHVLLCSQILRHTIQSLRGKFFFLFTSTYAYIYPQNCHGAVHKKVAKIKN